MVQLSAIPIVEPAREAQRSWSRVPLRQRLQIVRKLRSEIATSAPTLINAFPASLRRTRADSLTAEIIPLAEACRFLELESESILRPQKLSRKARPFWLRRVEVEVRREPFGVVLLIGPANYPLFLIGVQALQAIVAGNAVLIKPGRGAVRVAEAFAELACRAGLPGGLITVLDESVDAGISALQSGVNKVVFTGSVQSGRAVLRQAAERLTPVTAELSGMDPVFVQAGADLKRAAAAVRFGASLNGGDTCIAPKRVYVHEPVAEPFRRELGNIEVPVFAVKNDNEALEMAAESSYALGATVFGEESEARELANRINAGVVVINDMIVPTADPRVPFGGRAASGYGTTRGAAGLLEMTTPKAIVVERAKRLRHLEPAPPNAEEFFLNFLLATHAQGFGTRMNGWRRFIKAISRIQKGSNQ